MKLCGVNQERKSFKDLETGELFYFFGLVYMKTENGKYSSTIDVNAVRIIGEEGFPAGLTYYFMAGEQVVPLKTIMYFTQEQQGV